MADIPAIIFYQQVTSYLLPSFESVGLSVQEKKFQIHFQDSGSSGHVGFLIRTILAIFDQTSFKSFGLSIQEKYFKIDFQNGGNLVFLIGMLLAISNPQVTPVLHIKVLVIWPFDSGIVIMPPTSKKLEGHIASGTFVRPCVRPSVRYAF